MDRELEDLLKYSEGRKLIERIVTGPRKYGSSSEEDMERMKLLVVGSTGTGMSRNALLKLHGENDKSNVVVIDPKMEVEENITIQADGKKQN
jgi:hypothetical protein